MSTDQDTQDTDPNMDFDMPAWAKKYGLTRKTEATLSAEEITSPEALLALLPQDLMELALPIGQRRLLQVAIDALRPRRPAAQATSSDASAGGDRVHEEASDAGVRDVGVADAAVLSDAGLTIEDIRRQAQALGAAGKAWDSLFAPGQSAALQPGEQSTAAGAGTSASASAQPAPKPAALLQHSDPRTILTVKSQGRKAVHITSFISERTKKRLRSHRRGTVLGVADHNIVLQTDEDHPYSGISIAEWGSANMRLMAYLLQSGELARDNVEFYMAYTTQVFEYAGLYDWEAVLEFDWLYRERQAEHSFMWGHIPPNMELTLVSRPRRHGQPQHPHAPGPARYPRNAQAPHAASATKTQECWLFKVKNGACPFGDNCRYDHPTEGAPKNPYRPGNLPPQ
jgi:hypothetical protein